MSTSSTKLLVTAGVLGGSLLWTSAALADGVVIGADGEWVRASSHNGEPSDEGVGIHARLGYQSEAMLFYLRPEVGGSATFDLQDTTQWRAYGGGRLGLTTGISPAVFAHAGYGWFANDERGFTWDFGGAVDFMFLPSTFLGAHISYVLNPEDVPNWLTIGGHVEVRF